MKKFTMKMLCMALAIGGTVTLSVGTMSAAKKKVTQLPHDEEAEEMQGASEEVAAAVGGSASGGADERVSSSRFLATRRLVCTECSSPVCLPSSSSSGSSSFVSLRNFDPNAASPWTRHTPLHCATKSGNSHLVQLLVDAGAVLRQSANSRTPLHMAALNPTPGMAPVLFGAAKNSMRECARVTVPTLIFFELASEFHMKDAPMPAVILMADAYTSTKSACVNARDGDNKTALEIATAKGHWDVAVEFLHESLRPDGTPITISQEVIGHIQNNSPANHPVRVLLERCIPDDDARPVGDAAKPASAAAGDRGDTEKE